MCVGGGDSPRGGGHDAASAVRRGPAAAAPLRRVVVHPEIVSELVGEGDGGAQRVVRVVLRRASEERIFLFFQSNTATR